MKCSAVAVIVAALLEMPAVGIAQSPSAQASATAEKAAPPTDAAILLRAEFTVTSLCALVEDASAPTVTAWARSHR